MNEVKGINNNLYSAQICVCILTTLLAMPFLRYVSRGFVYPQKQFKPLSIKKKEGNRSRRNDAWNSIPVQRNME